MYVCLYIYIHTHTNTQQTHLLINVKYVAKQALIVERFSYISIPSIVHDDTARKANCGDRFIQETLCYDMGSKDHCDKSPNTSMK